MAFFEKRAGKASNPRLRAVNFDPKTSDLVQILEQIHFFVVNFVSILFL
jgi:hypothetical protein